MVFVTGAFGCLGYRVIMKLLKNGFSVRALDLYSSKNKRKADTLLPMAKNKNVSFTIIWGDLREKHLIRTAMQACSHVIHLAAYIPPAAERNPKLSYEVNVRGTANILEEAVRSVRNPWILYTSSIAVYGDRRSAPHIHITDKPKPNKNDVYAQNKLLCEKMIQQSHLSWTIFRLTYIVDKETLKLDPLMFHMPLDTCIEICHVQDAASAIVSALGKKELLYKKLNIAGGPSCRTTYRQYLTNMLRLFGFGKKLLPEEAFSKAPFHCGYMDSEANEPILCYQQHSLEEFYNEVREKYSVTRFFVTMVRPFMRLMLLLKSPYFRANVLYHTKNKLDKIEAHFLSFLAIRFKKPKPKL